MEDESVAAEAADAGAEAAAGVLASFLSQAVSANAAAIANALNLKVLFMMFSSFKRGQ
ncbi:hypothetical protein NEIMUCOT_04626 [Neisseria mucosa ATCC 25996]|jgi:FKBP-type peptidyl-prolyl cis-trans isomerase fklB|uniref:Uncharacterized protein n=1 Tax=Neisseria mucosa (strain ATCC 25996 / DSM 4631 / NCTC 10774 / M26) TaxID=546266 RepID=D2ZVI3_NEIM2|nr:hypothetical protein NEIMUCOT_04626 [Neisseria mucosa ATCC 25996]